MSEFTVIPAPDQLTEFQLPGSQYSRFLPESDCLPYYVFARTNVAPVGAVTRRYQFTQGLSRLTVEIFPARRVNPGTGLPRSVFPGEREQLVSAAIRAQAVRHAMSGVGVARNAEGRPAVMVAFSYRDLRGDLSQSGHALSHAQLKEAIEVLSDTRIRLSRKRAEKGDSENLTYNLFANTCLVTENVW